MFPWRLEPDLPCAGRCAATDRPEAPGRLVS
jgi:hypothetical protein